MISESLQRISAPAASNLGNRMVTDEEGVLIARSRNGDLDAFAALVRMHQRMIHSLAYRMTGSSADADDLTQEAFISAHRSLESYRGTAKFSSWLYRITLNLCIRWKKLERRRTKTDGDWIADDSGRETPDIRGDRVQEALNTLSPKQRAAVVLTVFDGASHAEAAALLGCPEATVSWRVFAARRRLARLLKDGGRVP
jgi:RNA polymerase sigma-70 factor (ECF subfamily)